MQKFASSDVARTRNPLVLYDTRTVPYSYPGTNRNPSPASRIKFVLYEYRTVPRHRQEPQWNPRPPYSYEYPTRIYTGIPASASRIE